MSKLDRILVICSDDGHWLWLSDALGERYTLVRETGNFESIAQRVGLVSPALAVVDFSPQVSVDPSVIVQELGSLAPDLPIIALGSKQSSEALVVALRSGVKDFIDLDSKPMEVQKIVDAAAESAPSSAEQDNGHAIVVLGGRPGVGATTLAVNLAACLRASTGDETLLLDFGLPLGDGLIHLPCDEKQGAMDFVECVRSLRRFDATLARTAFKRNQTTDVSVLSLPRNLADLREVSAQDALKFLVLIKSFFNRVVIDVCGFNNIDFVANLLRIADAIIVVSNQSVPSVVTAAEQVKALGDRGISSEKMTLVVNQFDNEVALSPETIANKLGIKRFRTIPSRRAALLNAVNGGEVLMKTSPKDSYSKAIAQLLESLNVEQSEQGPSILSSLMKRWVKT